jgi:hypothetical protein
VFCNVEKGYGCGHTYIDGYWMTYKGAVGIWVWANRFGSPRTAAPPGNSATPWRRFSKARRSSFP